MRQGKIVHPLFGCFCISVAAVEDLVSIDGGLFADVVEHEHLHGPVGQEEAVGALVDFLAAEIPAPEINLREREHFYGQVNAMGGFVRRAGTSTLLQVLEGTPEGAFTHVAIAVDE